MFLLRKCVMGENVFGDCFCHYLKMFIGFCAVQHSLVETCSISPCRSVHAMLCLFCLAARECLIKSFLKLFHQSIHSHGVPPSKKWTLRVQVLESSSPGCDLRSSFTNSCFLGLGRGSATRGTGGGRAFAQSVLIPCPLERARTFTII